MLHSLLFRTEVVLALSSYFSIASMSDCTADSQCYFNIVQYLTKPK